MINQVSGFISFIILLVWMFNQVSGFISFTVELLVVSYLFTIELIWFYGNWILNGSY